ncbi:MAG TPA: hypothetical protein VIL46_03845 [Gemmataceae bacterium]
MRLVRWGGPAVLAGLVCGCLLPEREPSASWWQRFRDFNGPQGPDVVFLEVARVEQPLADPYLDRGVWRELDEQVVPIPRKALLNANGVRVGVTGGILPAELHALLTSEGSCREPRRHRLRAGNVEELTLNGPLPECRFERVRQPGGEGEAVEFTQAEWVLLVTPHLGEDGRVRLHFLPELRHGEKKFWRPGAGGDGGLSLQGRQAAERFDELAWELSLSPNEYAVVGTRCSEPDSVGYQWLIGTRGANPVQRLLVIRAGRVAPAPLGETAAPPGGDRHPPPLALQAKHTVARGAEPDRD